MAQIGSFALLLALALAAYSFLVGMIALFFQSGHESEGMDRVGETARRAGIGKAVTPHAQTRLHHRRQFGCRSAIAGCARSGVTCGPAHHDPV